MDRFIKCLSRVLILSVAGLFAVLAMLAPVSLAVAQKNVPRHDLDCSAAFPCPASIQRRVDFWVEVFSEWERSTAVLHDADSPWRVYQTHDGTNGCNDKKVKGERKRLRANLNALADRLKKDQPPKGQIQQNLAEQFDRLNSKIVYKAAKNIRCQLGVKDQFTNALSRFERYGPLVKKIIAETNMPEDLLYLPFVESSYRADAYSKVGAAGMWQIMPKTARSLGMELNAVRDDRLDPEAATRGAMRYFKKAQKSIIPLSKEAKPGITQAEINPFIVTSYNYGVSGMRRAIKEVGPDFPKVLSEYKSAAFQVAVKNFYASFLAAGHLARNADQYFGETKSDTELAYQTFILTTATSISRIKHVFGLSEQDLKPLNPALTRFAWNGWRLVEAGYHLNLPHQTHRWLAQIDQLNALEAEPQPLSKQVYRVRKGDTACGIANAFQVKCRSLISANRLGRKAAIRIGQKLDIPGRPVAKAATTASVKTPAKMPTKTPTKAPAVASKDQAIGLYVVKSGDTACKLASRFGVACRELIRLNKLGRKARLSIGQKLRVPGLGGESVVASSNRASLQHKVKKGDTACEIAQRYAIPCPQLIADNQLGRKANLRLGQLLTIGGRSIESSDNVSVSEYQVRKGDTACRIAERFDTPCSDLIRRNQLGKRARLKVGQVLIITSIVGAQTISEGADEQQHEWLKILDQLPQMNVVTTSDGVTIKTLPNETLEHYADWMGSRSLTTLRELNQLKKGADLALGRSIKLPITLADTRARFESKRSEFHQVIVEEFKERFKVTGVKTIALKSGQSLWSISRTYDTPLWLLMRFNPDLGSALKLGQSIVVPVISR